jgi:aspartate/methionine/tyrosine aminotransferase
VQPQLRGRHRCAGGAAATRAAQRFQPDAAAVAAAWTPRPRGVLLASPSNPTGTSVDPAEMRAIVQAVRARGGVMIADEIYLGLSYDPRYARSALALGEDVISVNSFSKYFSMTGWRLGWLVLPDARGAAGAPGVEPVHLREQPCAAGGAGLLRARGAGAVRAAPRRAAAPSRPHLAGLARAGLPVPVEPDGAFYAWADCSAHAASSWDLCHRLVDEAHVVLHPGRDFGPAHAERHLRLSFASAAPQLELALQRLARTLGPGAPGG